MAGTVKVISGEIIGDSMEMVIEYNSNDSYALVWQENISVPRMNTKDVVDFADFVGRNILPEAANKILARRKIVDLTPAFQSAVTNGTLYTVVGT